MPSGNPGQKRKPHSEETRRKMSASKKGKTLSYEHRRRLSESHKGQISYMLGKKHTKEARNKISKMQTGKPRLKQRGELSNLWKGGITTINAKIRTSLEYKIWRRSVFERDGYTCVWCELKSGNGKAVYLCADHIKPFSLFPELRFAIDNGRTLCLECHKKTDTFGNKIRNARLDKLEEKSR